MSGGSYGYLFNTQPERWIEWSKREDLERMYERLLALGYANDAALQTQKFIEAVDGLHLQLEALYEKQQPLSDVWKAIEWWDSCDWGEAQVKQTLKKYRANESQ